MFYETAWYEKRDGSTARLRVWQNPGCEWQLERLLLTGQIAHIVSVEKITDAQALVLITRTKSHLFYPGVMAMLRCRHCGQNSHHIIRERLERRRTIWPPDCEDAEPTFTDDETSEEPMSEQPLAIVCGKCLECERAVVLHRADGTMTDSPDDILEWAEGREPSHA